MSDETQFYGMEYNGGGYGFCLILFAGGSNKGIEEWEPLNDQMGIVMGMKGDERAAEVVNELPDLAVSPVNATLPMAEAASAESASDRAADGLISMKNHPFKPHQSPGLSPLNQSPAPLLMWQRRRISPD